MDEYPGYEEIGRLNPENYYTCDECGENEFAFDENMDSQGWNRMFRVGDRDLCEWCLKVHMRSIK